MKRFLVYFYVKSTTAFALILTLLLSAPSVAQESPLLNPSLAVNLEGISDWSTQHPFINAAKYARPWLGHLEGRWGGISNEQLRATGHVNERGWPVGMPDNTTKLTSVVFTNQPQELRSTRGRYRLTYEGDVDIGVGGAARTISQKTGEIWFEYPENTRQLVAIDLTRINPADPLSRLDIVHEDNILAHEVSAIFNPNWLKHIKDFRVIRMMTWMETNNSPVRSWDEMPSVGDYSYTNGVPIEVMTELANQVGIDPWFTLPHMSDDTLVRNFAKEVRSRLNPNLKAYIEYSNELWNFQFEQARWAGEQAKQLWGNAAGGDAWIQFAGLRAAQISQLFDDEFGQESDDRLVHVVAVHTAWTDLAEAQLTGRLLKRTSKHDPSVVFDAYAVTGYLTPGFGDDFVSGILRDWFQQGGKENLFKELDMSIRTTQLHNLKTNYWPAHAARAKQFELDLIMYEGGTHVILPYNEPKDEELIGLLTEFNYSPYMVRLYDETMQAWEETGGRLFNAFVDVSRPSRYGSWGHLRHIDDSTERWKSVIRQNAISNDYESDRDLSVFQNGLFLQSLEGQMIQGTPRNDVLLGTDADESMVPYGGLDRVHGGNGIDQLILSGSLASYKFSFFEDRIVASSQSQTVHFAGIEYVVFPSEGIALAVGDL